MRIPAMIVFWALCLGAQAADVAGVKFGERSVFSDGAPIAGEDFYRALLRVWIGDEPVQGDLKDALLGKGG